VQGVVEVAPSPEQHHLTARIRLPSPAVLIRVADRLRRIFDLGADPDVIARHLRRDALLARALAAVPGVRVPGAWDGFELAVRAILGQQVSVAAATRLAGRLVERHGEPLAVDGGSQLRFVFPTPDALAEADPSALGVPRARGMAIVSLARAVAEGRIELEASRGLEDTVRELAAIPGLGDWTAQYVAMRALREPDALPAADLALRSALGGAAGPAEAERVRAKAESWRPWRAYGAMLLWQSGAGARRSARARTRPTDTTFRSA
jgi:AraC family transcriptional regulator of adaptative response / DNA-3-methyladenine glycosylase II